MRRAGAAASAVLEARFQTVRPAGGTRSLRSRAATRMASGTHRKTARIGVGTNPSGIASIARPTRDSTARMALAKPTRTITARDSERVTTPDIATGRDAGDNRHLKLHVRLREQAALEALRVHGSKELFQGHDDAQPSASPLAPVCAAENVSASRVVVVRRVWIEQVHPADSSPPGRSLSALTEKRHAPPLDVSGDERIVGGGQVLRRCRDVRTLVAAHHDGDVTRAISRVPPVRVEAGEMHAGGVGIVGEGTHAGAALHALVLVRFSASVALAVVHANVELRAIASRPQAGADIAGTGDQPLPLREHGSLHTVTVGRFLEREPRRLVHAEDNRGAVADGRFQVGILQA